MLQAPFGNRRTRSRSASPPYQAAQRFESSTMQLMGRLITVLLLVWTVRGSALPGEDKLSVQSSREQTKARKVLILKMLSDLLDGADVGHDTTFSDSEDQPENKLDDEPSVLGRLPQFTQRDRKAPCKNFFWKTFTAC